MLEECEGGAEKPCSWYLYDGHDQATDPHWIHSYLGRWYVSLPFRSVIQNSRNKLELRAKHLCTVVPGTCYLVLVHGVSFTVP
jgi:hypothetical protein